MFFDDSFVCLSLTSNPIAFVASNERGYRLQIPSDNFAVSAFRISVFEFWLSARADYAGRVTFFHVQVQLGKMQFNQIWDTFNLNFNSFDLFFGSARLLFQLPHHSYKWLKRSIMLTPRPRYWQPTPSRSHFSQQPSVQEINDTHNVASYWAGLEIQIWCGQCTEPKPNRQSFRRRSKQTTKFIFPPNFRQSEIEIALSSHTHTS